jgi:hypothetical protein
MVSDLFAVSLLSLVGCHVLCIMAGATGHQLEAQAQVVG